MKYHKTKTGEIILLTELKDDHLNNIIRFIECKANEGITVGIGGGYTAEDMWYDKVEYRGKAALRYLNYSTYTQELERRKQLKQSS